MACFSLKWWFEIYAALFKWTLYICKKYLEIENTYNYIYVYILKLYFKIKVNKLK